MGLRSPDVKGISSYFWWFLAIQMVCKWYPETSECDKGGSRYISEGFHDVSRRIMEFQEVFRTPSNEFHAVFRGVSSHDKRWYKCHNNGKVS